MIFPIPFFPQLYKDYVYEKYIYLFAKFRYGIHRLKTRARVT